MKKYHRAICFTKIPLGGQYRYKDLFQIFPADLENIPKSSFQKHYPNILEYWTTDEEVIPISTEFDELNEFFDKTAATFTKQDRILGLLSAFTNNHFFRYTDTIGQWGIPMLSDSPGPESNSWSSKWCLPWFHFPDLPRQFNISEFSNLKVSPIERTEHRAYYMYDPNIDFDSDKTLTLPSTIDEQFDSYYSLDKAVIPIVDSAVSYIVSAIDLMNSKKTLSLLAAFTALETMVNLEFKNIEVEKCGECGQLKYSVAKKFREYLLKYLGNSENNKRKFNKYYSLRSKIIHTGRQLKTELLFADATKAEKDDEFLTCIEILQIGKLGIINWLLLTKRLNEKK